MRAAPNPAGAKEGMETGAVVQLQTCFTSFSSFSRPLKNCSLFRDTIFVSCRRLLKPREHSRRARVQSTSRF